MRGFIAIVFCALALVAGAQTIITGKVSDEKGEGIPFANVYLDQYYDGASANLDGEFSFETSQQGDLVLVVSAIGYATTRTPFQVKSGDRIKLNPVVQRLVSPCNQ